MGTECYLLPGVFGVQLGSSGSLCRERVFLPGALYVWVYQHSGCWLFHLYAWDVRERWLAHSLLTCLQPLSTFTLCPYGFFSA